MAPTLTHVHSVGKSHVIPQHRHSMSITHTKGLLNGPGQNNCFLNSAVQVLWHLDIFRRSFRELCGHACMEESCIFCALKELFAQFQYSHESALPPDALRRALAETFFNQQRFQLGFMDDAAECFENILLRIHFHIANKESEDMCNATHCIPHQKFAMTLVEQGVCHACGATSEPLSFTQMVHYVTSSTLCAQAKLNRESGDTNGFLQDFGKLLRKAGGMGEIRDCPSACGAKIQIQRTLMNHPEIVSIGIVWDSERPTLEHIMDVFHTIGGTIRLQDVFHSVVDDRWGASTVHQLVGIVTYYGKHYSTFFFHTKLRVWIYFDDATVREIGPRWEQVVEKCLRGHFQPLLLLYANPLGNPVTTESAPKTVTYAHGHPNKGHHRSLEKVSTNQKDNFVSPLRRAMTPNPEKQRDTYTDIIPRRAITPNPEIHTNGNIHHDKTQYWNHNGVHGNGFALVDNGQTKAVGRPTHQHPGTKIAYEHGYSYPIPTKTNNTESSVNNSVYNGELLQNLMQKQNIDCLMRNGHVNNKSVSSDSKGPLRANGYFNNCDVIDGYRANPQLSSSGPYLPINTNENTVFRKDLINSESIYISRKTVENVLNYQKKQRHRSTGSENNDSAAGSRNSNSSLESFENALRMRSHYTLTPYDAATTTTTYNKQEAVDMMSITSNGNNNVPRCRDSGNWSGDRNSASSTSSTSIENPYFIMAGNKRSSNSFRGSPSKTPMENGALRSAYDAGYDSFSLSSNDSFPVSYAKHNQQLAQIPENPNKLNSVFATRMTNNQTEVIDECHSLCLEADKFLEKSMENERNGDIDGAISLCNGAAAKARAAMDAPYSNPQILVLARMKHNSCVMRARTLHRRLLVRHDSISSHGSSSTGTDLDSPHKGDLATVGHHSRQSSRDSTRSRSGNHSRQSSRDGGGGVGGTNHNHNRQGSKDATTSHGRQNSQDAADKKRIELYGTLPKRNSKKKADKLADSSLLAKNDSVNFMVDIGFTAPPVTPNIVKKDTRIPRRTGFVSQPSLSQPSSQSAPHHHTEIIKTKQPTPSAPVNDISLHPHRDWYQPVDPKGDLPKAEQSRKSTLHRTNSVPSSYASTELQNSRSCTDISSSTTAKDDAATVGKGSGAKLGKKQHKIRRKLLMGGLIRRKNRSMPDLREGQNTSPSSESSQRCYDDIGLQQPQLAMQTFDNGQSNASLSCHNLYYASQRQQSPHCKIPPPPPVRTTSQLTTRSQSHSSLIHPSNRGAPRNFGVAPSVVPTSNYSTLDKRIVGHPQQSMLRQTSNKVTTQADVHHERTPSDGIKPVSLVRTLSCREATPNSQLQRPSNHARLVNGINPQLQNVASLHPPPPLPPQREDGATSIERQQRLDANDSTPNTGGGGGCGLLEQLLSKRQQMLDNPSPKTSDVPDVKSQLSKSDNWLHELQAKQQQMLKKKQGCLLKMPSISTTSTLEEAASNREPLHATPAQIHASQVQPITTSPMNTEAKSNPSYKPKSVRDLASKFEQISVNPPVTTQTTPSSVQPVVANGLKSELPSEDVTDSGFNAARTTPKLQHKQVALPPRSVDLNSSGANFASQLNTMDELICDAANTKLLLPSSQYQNGHSNAVNGNMYQNSHPYNSAASNVNVQNGYGQLHHHHYQQQQLQQQHTQQQQLQQQHPQQQQLQHPQQQQLQHPQQQQLQHSQQQLQHSQQHVLHPQQQQHLHYQHQPYQQHQHLHNQQRLQQQHMQHQHLQRQVPQQQHPQPQQYQKQQYQVFNNDSTSTNSTLPAQTWPKNSGMTPPLGYRELGLPPPPYPGPYQQPPTFGMDKTLGRSGSTSEPCSTKDVGCVPKAVPETVDSNKSSNDVDAHGPAPVIANGERTFQRKKSKKSVTFSDQVALVACADDHECFSLLNPLLEKVLQKSSPNCSSSSSNSNVAFAQQPAPVNYSKPNGQQVGLPASSENGIGLHVPSVSPQRSAIPTYVHNGEKLNRTSTSSQWPSSNGVPSETPCNLCHKKTVVAPAVYCRDCDFYMSRFKPKN